MANQQETGKTTRYWRLNSLMALRATRASEQEAQDPADLKAIQTDNTELARLEARKNAVKARYNRMKSRVVTL